MIELNDNDISHGPVFLRFRVTHEFGDFVSRRLMEAGSSEEDVRDIPLQTQTSPS